MNTLRTSSMARLTDQSYKKCLQDSSDSGVAFTDSLFRAEDSSVFTDRSFLIDINISRIVWKRPREMTDDPRLIFTQKLGPSSPIDIPVGVGPCPWILAAAAVIAQHKPMVYHVIPKDQINFIYGIFKVYIWNFGRWTKIIIDDKLPTFDDKLAFSSSKSSEVFWLPLVEKALAKMYGNYEKLYRLGSFQNALTHFTGSPIESMELDDGADHKAVYRLIVEELDRKSLLAMKTKEGCKTPGLEGGKFYLITGVQKPSLVSFRKTVKPSKALTHVYPAEDTGSTKPREICLDAEQLTESMHTLFICHHHKLMTSLHGTTSSQFALDVKKTSQEVIFELSQETNNKELGLSVHRIEINRKFKTSHFDKTILEIPAFQQKSIVSRITLSEGRYLVKPMSIQEFPVLFRVDTHAVSELRSEPEKNIWNVFKSTPKLVTRIVLKEVSGLERPSDLGPVDPFCVVKCGREKVETPIAYNTLNPDFKDFSAIFYHQEKALLIIEVYQKRILHDLLMGQASVVLSSGGNEDSKLWTIDLKKKSDEGETIRGTVKLIIHTSTDLFKF